MTLKEFLDLQDKKRRDAFAPDDDNGPFLGTIEVCLGVGAIALLLEALCEPETTFQAQRGDVQRGSRQTGQGCPRVLFDGHDGGIAGIVHRPSLHDLLFLHICDLGDRTSGGDSCIVPARGDSLLPRPASRCRRLLDDGARCEPLFELSGITWNA